MSALEVLTETIAKSVLSSINQRLERNNETIIFEVKGLLADSTSDFTERAAKWLKSDNPKMVNPGNADQYHHNNDVLWRIEKAANSVIKGDGEASIVALNQGKKLISDRQKLVKLADREEKGWKFVREYVKDKLADDSDDEKQIKRARKAVQEIFPPRRQQQSNRGSTRGRGNFRRSNNNYRQDSGSRDHYQGSSSSRSGNQRNDFRRDRFNRECYVCR